MSTKEEIEKVGTWLKNWLPDSSYSNQDIRELCRGPMKGIFQDFLVPRFPTEDQTYVIRSNLYAYGERSTLPDAPGRDVEEETLRRQLEDIDLEKDATLKGLLDKSQQLRELQEDQRKGDYVADTLGFKRRHVANLKEMIILSNTLLEDLKPLLITDEAVYMEKENHYDSFKTIQQEAISLFHSMFLEGTASNDLVEKNNKIHRLIEQVVQGGLSSKEIIRWHKDELDTAKLIVTETKNQFVKVNSSPLEELAKEAENLKQFLTKQHLDLYDKNVELATQIEKTTDAKQQAQMDVIEDNFGTFAPVDFLKFVRKEELKSKLKQCQKISEQSVNIGQGENQSSENLNSSGICGDKSDSIMTMSANTDSNVNQEKLEDIVSGLLRNWPATKSKLINVAKKGREIIPDQFISALKEEGKKPIDNPQSHCFLHSMINKVSESEGISSYSGFQTRGSYNEPSLLALNPNAENWRVESFEQKYNENQHRRDDLQDLTSLKKVLQQLEQTSAKTGSANIEILEHLIHDTKLNLNRFCP